MLYRTTQVIFSTEDFMGKHLNQVPPDVQGHLRQITKTSGLPDTEDAVDMIAQGWLEKRDRFDRIIDRSKLEQIELLEKNDARGCLVMTISGSLINIGPLREQGRTVQYTSIGLRKDVPEAAEKPDARLSTDVVVGAPVAFEDGPIASSSPVLKIAVTEEEMDLEEQERLITKATRALTKEFIEVNRELEVDEG
jgi:hypothetical protein